MTRETAVLVIDDPHEAALVASAIALHMPRLQVRTVPDWGAAHAHLADTRVSLRLVIAGARAIGTADHALPLADRAINVVGLAPDIPAALRARAVAAGIRAIYDRPTNWEKYAETVRIILRDWLGA